MKTLLELISVDNFESFLLPNYEKEECPDIKYDYNSLRNALLAHRVFGWEVYTYQHDYTHQLCYSNLIENQMYEFGRSPEDTWNMAKMSLVNNVEELAEKILPDYATLSEDFNEKYMENLMFYRDNMW